MWEIGCHHTNQCYPHVLPSLQRSMIMPRTASPPVWTSPGRASWNAEEANPAGWLRVSQCWWYCTGMSHKSMCCIDHPASWVTSRHACRSRLDADYSFHAPHRRQDNASDMMRQMWYSSNLPNILTVLLLMVLLALFIILRARGECLQAGNGDSRELTQIRDRCLQLIFVP